MKHLLGYLDTLLNDLQIDRDNKEALANSKIIEANEVHKAISKLTVSDNNTYNVFSASGSRMEFQSNEIKELKVRESELRIEADKLSDEIKNINNKIESLAIAIAHANSSSDKIEKMDNEIIHLNAEIAMYKTGGKSSKIKSAELDSEKSVQPDVKTDETPFLSGNVEEFDLNKDSNSFLEEIADRLYFISRILKFDPIRTKLELDEVYKSIIKYINK